MGSEMCIRDSIYTGAMMSGAEAVAAGLFSRAMPVEEVFDFTLQRAALAAAGPTAAFVASKRLIARLRGERLWDALAEEARGQEALRSTADYREGFAAFQQKRKPDFTGE